MIKVEKHGAFLEGLPIGLTDGLGDLWNEWHSSEWFPCSSLSLFQVYLFVIYFLTLLPDKFKDD